MVAKLNAALNRPVTEPIAWPDKLREEKTSVTDEQLLDLLERTNPELQALEFEIAKRKLSIDLAKKDYFPDVMVGLDYIDTADSTGGRCPGDDGKDPVIAMVSINLLIWWNKLSAGVREARYRYWSALHDKTEKASMTTALFPRICCNMR